MYIIKPLPGPPWHTGLNHANSEQEFMPSDSKENFELLCKTPEYVEYFRQQGWLEPGGITYKINSQGFRCDEFDDRDCMVALGCSFTMGIGLSLHQTWPQILAKQLGLACRTLAWGGMSADTCFRFAEYWIPILKPKAVFMLAPPPNRIEVIKAVGDQLVDNYLPFSETGNKYETDSFLKHWYSQEENHRLNSKKNQLAVKQLAAELDIPCFTYQSLSFFAKSREEVGYARDRMHAGPVGQQQVAERMLDDWSKK